MRPLKLLHNLFKKELPFIHKKRLNALEDCCVSLISGNTLTLTHLGRNMSGKAKEGSNIERVNRLLGNQHLHEEIPYFYQLVNQWLIEEGSTPCILVDWSCISSTTQLYVLRATLSIRGRSFTVYQEVHPKKKENNHETHVCFLNRLKMVLPEKVNPIIVTDAGFKTPWFIQILLMGWNFIGRLRGNIAVDIGFNNKWLLVESIYEHATSKSMHLGRGALTKQKEVECNFILYKSPKKGRVARNKDGQRSKKGHSEKHAKANKEPWFLATSLLPESCDLPELAVKIYTQRMQIEETFRDTKCNRYGFGLCESGTKSARRMDILLLIDFISSFVCWQSGLLSENNNTASDFQAHSSKFKNILSVIYLGKQALKRGIKMTKRQFFKIIIQIKILASSQLELAF